MLDRKIVSNRIDYDLPDNSIQTNKYTKWNFMPKNLLEQFSKKANIYFLFIGIMQTIPYITISNGLPAIFLPLVAILLITALKDFFEDNFWFLWKFKNNQRLWKRPVYRKKMEGFESRQYYRSSFYYVFFKIFLF